MNENEFIIILEQFRDREGNSQDDIRAFDYALECIRESKIYKKTHKEIGEGIKECIAIIESCLNKTESEDK